ncbi:MAG: chondroitinase family polysaccharide lyase [Candidatus Pedobacter colombiensis]|uniref:Chondroitinase family polysaccharide lyase n=1 Tax=Candidatus Pedobacter colombiensis TaxID=3121371 RepID=A0AAJ5WAH4_9SPHI|nr:chondroitinase family polysaccharide lyase [Pedobacter sp.]WEK20035.1 MAG: chondroitinase family polysaccharide lyase [Pedobacter sp.]
MSRLFFFFLFVCCQSIGSYAQIQTDICENSVPNNWSTINGRLSITTDHFKLGEEAIKWDWITAGKSVLKIQNSAFKAVAANPRSTFVVWIYNETPVNDRLVFKFGTNDKTACSFDFKLNFKGWRTAWVMYHRDMVGRPQADMDLLTIAAPATIKKGSLFIDQLMYDVTINPRSPMRDEQLPFINPDADKAANAHWTSLYLFNKTPQYLPLQAKLGEVDRVDLDQISQRFKEQILPSEKNPGKNTLQNIEKAFSYWNISRNGDRITGRPVYSMNDVELVSLSPDEGVKEANRLSGIKAYTQLMLQVAQAYHTSPEIADKQRMEQIFMDLLDHLEDQGWAFGSGMGALHHHGYNLGGYYPACLLMKDVIKKHNKLDRTFKSMAWFSGLGRTLQLPDQLPASNIDVFNTLLESMLSAILIMDDSPKKLQYLHSFSNWLSKNIEPDHTIEGAFKPDGAVFHHGNLYPAYGIGGYTGIAPIVYALSGTSFRVEQYAHESLRNSLLMIHYYTNPYKWPISVSGRHPTGNWRIPDVPYAYMAMAGTPDGSSKTDTLMASIYLKLNGSKQNKWTAVFKNSQIKPIGYTNGHWNLNYGLFDIHRRQDWLLTIRSHNRYFISNESYPGANMYGRYIAYGQLEVLYPDTKADDGSNFKDEGWDWNNIPGTTTLHLPLNKLRANIINADDYSGIEEMLISDERFAGGTTFNKQGMFAMKLHGHDKYDMGSFRAIKSWFMFDNLVVSLGSGIQNTIAAYPTETTLFQNYLKDSTDVLTINGAAVNSFPYTKKGEAGKSLTIIDNRNIGYYIPNAGNTLLTKATQVSRDQKDSRKTTGNFAKLILQHGNAPINAGYEYAMLIKTNKQALETLALSQESTKPLYKVLQKDSAAHIVWYAPQQITALAVFGSNNKLSDSLLMGNNRPCLLMYQQKEKQLSMSVTDPDLAFYEGPDDSPLTADGKRKEVSIYSRKWYRSPAKPSIVELLIKGNWEVKTGKDDLKVTLQSDGNTMVSVKCADGVASKIELFKRK